MLEALLRDRPGHDRATRWGRREVHRRCRPWPVWRPARTRTTRRVPCGRDWRSAPAPERWSPRPARPFGFGSGSTPAKRSSTSMRGRGPARRPSSATPSIRRRGSSRRRPSSASPWAAHLGSHPARVRVRGAPARHAERQGAARSAVLRACRADDPRRRSQPDACRAVRRSLGRDRPAARRPTRTPRPRDVPGSR